VKFVALWKPYADTNYRFNEDQCAEKTTSRHFRVEIELTTGRLDKNPAAVPTPCCSRDIRRIPRWWDCGYKGDTHQTEVKAERFQLKLSQYLLFQEYPFPHTNFFFRDNDVGLEG
jgi:hypothetical protein